MLTVDALSIDKRVLVDKNVKDIIKTIVQLSFDAKKDYRLDYTPCDEGVDREPTRSHRRNVRYLVYHRNGQYCMTGSKVECEDFIKCKFEEAKESILNQYLREG